jgi:pimeloyl-ACP methyl ester carboxylesterase
MTSTVEVAGIQSEHHVGGGTEPSAPPLVLIHGAAGHHLFWPPEIRRLPGWEVYAVDLPGHGGSLPPAESTVGGYADRLGDWLRGLGLAEVVLAGHSMGAAIALTLALRLESVAGLVLIGAGASLPVHPDLIRLSESRQTFPEAVDRIVRGSFSRSSDAHLVALARQRMLEGDPAILLLDFQACARFDVTHQLGDVRCPALVICGAEDRMTSEAQNRRLALGLPGGELQVLAGAGHMAMLEQPQAVAGLIGAYLHGLRPKARPAG